MKNALILHGAGNNSQGNWFPYLKKELNKLGFEVWVPELPNSDTPNQQDWLDIIFQNPDWHFSSESILVGHSAGATLILRILEKLPNDIQIAKAILVAGFVELGTKPEYFKYKKSLLETPFDWEKIKSSCREFVFIASDNDPYLCGVDQAKILQEHLGGDVVLKLGEGHFNLEAGEKYHQFPELLKLIENE